MCYDPTAAKTYEETDKPICSILTSMIPRGRSGRRLEISIIYSFATITRTGPSKPESNSPQSFLIVILVLVKR